jgi:TetR/AcrR family transcriptional regulator, transcriptional repressor for nem operon
MKVSKETAAEHREKILTAASRRFRELGYDGISVSDLMKEAGLTHGGFYGHFESKEELARVASDRAIQNSLSKWERVIREARSHPLTALATTYLSRQHRDSPGSGCLFAALSSDTPRQPDSIRQTVSNGFKDFLALLESIVSGKKKSARRRKAIAVSAALIGGLVLARTVKDPELSNEILETVAASLAE